MALDKHYLHQLKTAKQIEFMIPAADAAEEFNNIYLKKIGDHFRVQLNLLLPPESERKYEHKQQPESELESESEPKPGKPSKPDKPKTEFEPAKHDRSGKPGNSDLEPAVPTKAWKTVLALDASASMKKAYGRRLLGSIPSHAVHEYKKKGWLSRENRDGRRVYTLTRPAVEHALERGFVRLTPNVMDYLTTEFVAYLAGKLDRAGKTTVLYWGGGRGKGIELIGELQPHKPGTTPKSGTMQTETPTTATVTFDGPAEMLFGSASKLLPALECLVNQYAAENLCLFVFLTDGRLDDLDQLKKYTRKLAAEIAANQRNFVRCILAGVGDEAEEQNLRELESLNLETNVKIWRCLMVPDLPEALQHLEEVTRDTQIAAQRGTIVDDQGNAIKEYADGLPQIVSFNLPLTAPWFELRLPDRAIRQSVIVPKYIFGGTAYV